MKREPQGENLLEHLFFLSGGQFISDLHNENLRPALCRALEATPWEEYPLKQWQEAVQYLCPEIPTQGDAAELRAALLSAMERQAWV